MDIPIGDKIVPSVIIKLLYPELLPLDISDLQDKLSFMISDLTELNSITFTYKNKQYNVLDLIINHYDDVGNCSDPERVQRFLENNHI